MTSLILKGNLWDNLQRVDYSIQRYDASIINGRNLPIFCTASGIPIDGHFVIVEHYNAKFERWGDEPSTLIGVEHDISDAAVRLYHRLRRRTVRISKQLTLDFEINLSSDLDAILRGRK